MHIGMAGILQYKTIYMLPPEWLDAFREYTEMVHNEGWYHHRLCQYERAYLIKKNT